MSFIEVSGFRFGFVLDQIDKLTDAEKRKAAQVLVPTLSPEESAVLQSYCGMNNEQRRKLRRCLAYQTGIRIIAPDGKVRELKENHFEDNCRSAEMTTKELKRPVKKTKNGSNILSRKSFVLVFTVRPLEHVVCAIRALFQSGEFKVRLGGPCTVGEIFSGKVVVKISADAGGGSFKIIINLVNVKNPQGQEHVHLVGEFSGIKDTPENIRLAFFEEDSIIRSDIEAILNRQCVIVCLKMSDGQLQTIVVENDDADHDIMNPKPLPALTGVTEESAATDEANEMGIGRLKFAEVHELKVLKNDGCFSGISFFDSRGGCVATVMLREHLDGVDFNGLEMKQYMLISAHAADMEYMSGLIGHQGASAKNPCIYNRAKNVDVKNMWNLEVDFPSYEDRTNENIDEDFECFQREYTNKLPRSSRTPALRKNVSQNMSHSIVDRKFYKFPMDVLNPGSMHVRTGNTRSLLDFVFHFYRQIADLVPGKHTKAAIFIEEEIRHLQIYLDYLDSQQKDVLMTLESKDRVLDDIVDTINRFRKVAFESPTLSQATRDEYARKLESLEQVYQSRTEGDDGDTEDEKKLKVQLLEQSCLVKNTIDHLQTLYKKHVCFSQRHIVDILKVYGVDLQVYFGGILIGPHCMNLAEHSEKILKAILAKMKEEVQDERLVKAMEKFTEKMVKIFAVWYELCMQMMSTKYQDDDAIAEWKRRVTAIKRLIVDLIVTDPPLPGEENPLKLPTTLKWFTLLSSIMLNFLKVWRCFGDVDEQNIESNHPQRNAMAARHRGRRGPAKNLAIMKELEIERAPWMRDGIKEMLEATKAKRAPILRTRAIVELSEDADATLETENAAIENESVTLYDYELEMNDCDALRIPDDFVLPDVLPDNNNNNQQVDADQEGLDPEYDVDLCLAVRGMDTTICACRECGERLIGKNAMKIHMNEIHNHSILEENDAVDATVV